MKINIFFWRITQILHYWKCKFSSGWSAAEIEQIRAARLFAKHGSTISTVTKHVQFLEKADPGEWSISDFGAVSGFNPAAENKYGVLRKSNIKSMLSRTASSQKWGRMLLRIAQLKSGSYNLELGSNLGIGLRYLVTGSHFQHQWISIEGDATTANLAIRALADQPQVRILTGRFADVLPSILADPIFLSLVFIDGHHDGLATIQYAENIAPKVESGGWMIFDDIRWSPSMKAGWERLKNSSWVDRWVDLGKMGILVVK
jgi:predicted O-methyltransferase YrrM